MRKMTTSAKQQNDFVGTTTVAIATVALSAKTFQILGEETPENKQFVVTEAWKLYDILCKNYILSCLEDKLYNVYRVIKTPRELWNTLEKKYKIEDAGLTKFVAAKLLDFKIVDGKSVITQLPPLWKHFKNYLKYKDKEMTLEKLIVRLWIEEDKKASEKKSRGNSTLTEANIVDEASTSNRKRKKPFGPKNYPRKKKFKGNTKEWWIDSGATRHVCANKELFASYVPVGPGETILMGNSTTTKIEGVGKISLKMTSGKVVTLNNVLHVPEIRNNSVSAGLLIKNGKSYLTDGLFKLNVVVIDINKVQDSSYLLESNNLWHTHLGHVNLKTIRKMVNLEVLPKFEMPNMCGI
ncbi:uncharacterized protein [Nicotiana tomentosiformis]|uniref:uncharacterized protein n=1 Tax=Nicotiana tomentosiformis TaxID=4098 RepID=UPI00388CB690